MAGDAVVINGSTYYRNSVSFYGSSNYDCAFGTAQVFFNTSGVPVGFYDKYDFNALPWGARSIVAEIGTSIIGNLGAAHGAKSYEIFYGIH